MKRRLALALALCAAAAVAVSACIGVPSGPNIHVCVRLSEAAAAACGPNGWPLPTGPSQGFWYETDDGSGSRSGVNQWVRNANFSVTAAGGTITFELVSRDGGSSGSADFACHPFAIVSRGASRERGGGCSRSGQSCAYGAQAGVSGPVPAYVTGQTVTLTAEINATYGYQSLDDTFMGGEIVVSNQIAAGADGGGADDSGAGSDSAAVKRGAMIAAVVIGVAAFAVLPLALGARYARRHGYWTGCCVCKRNPNLAATAAGAGSASTAAAATAPAPTLSEVALDVHSGGGGGGGGSAADVAHVKLSEDLPAAASDAPATWAGAGSGAGAGVRGHGAAAGADAMR